jgi:hypothetical protein
MTLEDSVCYSVSKDFSHYVLNSIYDCVCARVCDSIRTTICESVWDATWYSMYSHVDKKIHEN